MMSSWDSNIFFRISISMLNSHILDFTSEYFYFTLAKISTLFLIVVSLYKSWFWRKINNYDQKIILHEFLQEFDHVAWLIHGFDERNLSLDQVKKEDNISISLISPV